MKIVQITSLYPPNIIGGAEQTTKNITDAMATQGHQLDVITLKGPRPVLETAEGNNPVHVHEIPLANIYWPFNGAESKPSLPEKILWHGLDTANELMAKRVKNVINQVQPDVVLTHNLQGFSTAVMPAIARMQIPLVHVLHDFSLLCPQTTLTRNGNPCGMQKERCKACRILTAPRFKHHLAADAVIGVSKAVLDIHLDHGMFAGKPATAIYNALRPSLTVAENPPVRHEGHTFTFGFLGRVEKSKGVETMLKAAEKLERNGVNFRLLIAGKGKPDYLSYLRKTWPLKSVEYAGFVNPAEFLPTLDTLIFPSEWMEALGNGVFEAFAYGVPVIGANTGGIPETIDHGINGVVFESGNWSHLAEYMAELQTGSQMREKLALAALEKAREYTPENRAHQYLDFLADVVNGKSQGAAA